MTRQPAVAGRAEELLDASVIATAPVAGGDISTATKLRLSNGTTALMKTLPHAPGGLLRARGARAALARRGRGRRRRARGPRPSTSECLILALGRAGQERRRRGRRPSAGPSPPPTRRARRRTGWTQRRLHRPAAAAQPHRPHLGGVLRDPADRCPTSSWPATAARSPSDDAAPSSRVVARGWPTWCPRSRRPGCTATSGTATCCGARTARVVVIDPAAYGGHREVDLAMLALFGLPHLPPDARRLRRGRTARRWLGGPARPPPAVPAARARLPVRRRVRRPRRRPPPPVRLARTARSLSADSGAAGSSGAVSRHPAQTARPRRRRRPGRARVAAALAGVQRVRRRTWPATAPRRSPASPPVGRPTSW